jgi:hypothetical protein
MPTQPTAEDLQAVHDFALQRGLFVKFWDRQKISLIITRDAPKETTQASERPATSADPQSHEGHGP